MVLERTSRGFWVKPLHHGGFLLCKTSHSGFQVEPLIDGSTCNQLSWVLDRTLWRGFKWNLFKRFYQEQKRVLLLGQVEEPYMVLVSNFISFSVKYKHRVGTAPVARKHRTAKRNTHSMKWPVIGQNVPIPVCTLSQGDVHKSSVLSVHLNYNMLKACDFFLLMIHTINCLPQL